MKEFFRRLHARSIEILLLPVKFYRKRLSGRKKAASCKYLPTCSEYCMIALRRWGVIRGSALAIWRVLRCNPFSKGGYDPVPERKKIKEKTQSTMQEEENRQ